MDSKKAIAYRIDGNLYDVSYPGTRAMDRAVPYAYLVSLVKHGGFTVDVMQREHRAPGEPEAYRMEPQ